MSTYYNNLLRRIRILESIIYEGKKDQEVLQNFLGHEYYDKFQLVKNKIKDPEYKDIYKLVKKDPNDVKDYIDNFQSKSDKRRDDKKGAKLLYEDPEWRVYKITTYPAAQYYGKGTKWCITGRYPGHEGKGEEYFYDYINDYDLDGGYYFYLNKVDPSLKYCVLQTNNRIIHSIWDAEDTNRGNLKSSISEISLPDIPEVNLMLNDQTEYFLNAIARNDIVAVKDIVESGINVNIANANGDTALSTAAFRGNKDIVEILLDADADPNMKDKEGYTPLINACINGNIEIVKLLLDAGANVDKPDSYKETALMYASKNKFIEIVKLLLDAGADPNKVDKYDVTALTYACMIKHNKKVVEMLLDAGADHNMKTSYGETARSFAIKNSDFDIVDLLEKYGAKE